MRNVGRDLASLALIGFAGALGVLGTVAAVALCEPVGTPPLVPEPPPPPPRWEAMFVDLLPGGVATEDSQSPW